MIFVATFISLFFTVHLFAQDDYSANVFEDANGNGVPDVLEGFFKKDSDGNGVVDWI